MYFAGKPGRKVFMTPFEVAFANAANGWPQFPVRHDKRPFAGFTDWEQKATLSAELISTWGTVDYPGCLWATTPGRVDKTVIDIDRHPGKVDGFEVLVALGLDLSTKHVYPSMSGKGRHAWYRGRSSSRNDLYTSIDRKSVGGYVITPYLLPPITDVRTRLISAFQGRSVVDDLPAHPYQGSESAWLAARDALTPSKAVYAVVKQVAREEFRGHANMLSKQVRLVHLGREGHGGVPEALDELREMWMAAEHGSNEDPAVEWSVALRGAIRTYGGVDDAGSVERRGLGRGSRTGNGGTTALDSGHGLAGPDGWDLVAAS
jgi:hypothetical protein